MHINRKKTIEEIRKELGEINDFKAPSIDDPYGYELILDLKNCDSSKFNRVDLDKFCEELCKLTKMRRADIHFWDFEGQEEQYEIYAEEAQHLCGTSLIQFINTSNITIHTLDIWKKIYLNLFTCKPFNHEEAKSFIVNYFKGEIVSEHFIVRN